MNNLCVGTVIYRLPAVPQPFVHIADFPDDSLEIGERVSVSF